MTRRSRSSVLTRIADKYPALGRLVSSPASGIGLAIIVAMILAALLAPWLAPFPEDAGPGVHFERAFSPPSWTHLFGTDEVGRDIFSRALFGATGALPLAFVSVALTVAIGVPLGLLAAWNEGFARGLILRLADILLAVPTLVLVLAIAAVLTTSFVSIALAIAVTYWPWYTRLVYAQALHLRRAPFVEAAMVSGVATRRILATDILPNLVSSVIIKATIDLGFVVLLTASLAFLGLGAQPDEASWGQMIAQGRAHLPDRWWVSTFPGLMIFFTVVGFNLLGDGLRDVFDTRLSEWTS